MSMLLVALRLCLTFFGLWDPWALPLRRLLFSLGIIPIDPTLVHSDDPRHEGWVIRGMLTKRLTNCNKVLFLFGGQKPGHKLCSNAVHVRIVCTVPYDTLTTAAMSLMVLRRSSCTSRRTVSTFLDAELVEGRPDLSSSLSDVLPLLKHACHSKHLARLWPHSHMQVVSFQKSPLQICRVSCRI